jgi:hypothetical protein
MGLAGYYKIFIRILKDFTLDHFLAKEGSEVSVDIGV